MPKTPASPASNSNPNPNSKLKRRREIRTCEYCYHHKLKCDRAQPCNTCVRRKHECIYQFQKKASFKDREDHFATLSVSPSHNGQFGSHILPHVLSSDVANSGNTSGIAISHNEQEEEKHHIVKNNPDYSKPEMTFVSNIINTPIYYSRAFFPYLEPSLNRMMLFKMSEMGDTGRVNTDFSHTGTYDFQRFSTPSTNALAQLVEEYPKKEYFDDTIYLYWDYIHPLIPVVDRKTTMVKYIKFWEDFRNPIEPKFDIDSGVLFLAMLLAVNTAFEISEKNNNEKSPTFSMQKTKLFDTFEKFKLIFGFRTNPNLAYIQSSIILFQSSCIYYMGIFTYTSAISRQAEFMGLHRDPLLHDVQPNKKNMREVEVRRQTWHFVRILDTAASVVSGMSPHMIMTNASAKFPSKREYNPETKKFDGQLNPFKVFAICRFKCSLVMETISHFLNSDFSSDNERILRWEGIEQTVSALYQDINNLIKDIFSCEKNPKYSKELLRWLVANASFECHRVYLLHRACDRRPYSHQNRVILKPINAAKVELTKLSQASSNKDFFDQVLTIRMPYYDSVVEVCILLLYEVIIRVSLPPELAKFKWFTKNANPFQYIYFVMRDIFHYPNKVYNFESLPKEVKNLIHDDTLMKQQGDVRKYVVNQCLDSLAVLKNFWVEPISDMMNFLCELRKYVIYATSNNSNENSSSSNMSKGKSKENGEMQSASNTAAEKSNDIANNSNSLNIDGDVNGETVSKDSENYEDLDALLNSDFQMDKYKNIIDMLSVMNKEQSLNNTPNQFQGIGADSIDSDASDSTTPGIKPNGASSHPDSRIGSFNSPIQSTNNVPQAVPTPGRQYTPSGLHNNSQIQSSFLTNSGTPSSSMGHSILPVQHPSQSPQPPMPLQHQMLQQYPHQPQHHSPHPYSLQVPNTVNYGEMNGAPQIPLQSVHPHYPPTMEQQVQQMQQMRHMQHMQFQPHASPQPHGSPYPPMQQSPYPYLPRAQSGMGTPISYISMPPHPHTNGTTGNGNINGEQPRPDYPDATNGLYQ